MRSAVRTWTAATVTALLALPLAGCGADPATSAVERSVERSVERAVERALEDGLEEGDAGVDVDVDGDQVTLTDKDGRTSVSVGAALPDDFPDLPLVDGEVVTGTGTDTDDGRGWAVSMRYDGAGEAALDEAVTRLEAVGFTQAEHGNFVMGEMHSAHLESAQWRVMVTALESDDTMVQYVVVPMRS